MNYDSKTFTYGFEIEWGDINRNLEIPKHLGKWEYCETDIVNICGEYKGIAADPLGKIPIMGGEINTVPSSTIEEQINIIMEIYDFFIKNGNTPTPSFISHGHIHVHIPKLKNDIQSLKRLIKYIKYNQKDCIDMCYNWREYPVMGKTAKQVMKLDGSRLMPDWMCDNIINLATDFEHFIFLHKAGKNGVSVGRPFRYAINTYCMKHINTVEFRFFRSSIERREIYDCFLFVKMFMENALNGGCSVKDILSSYDFQFPKFNYNHDLYLSWEKTKWSKERGSKIREFVEVSNDN